MAERDVNRSAHQSKESLITAIKEVFADLPREMVKKACSRFWSRLERVIAANGNFIEYKSYLNISINNS